MPNNLTSTKQSAVRKAPHRESVTAPRPSPLVFLTICSHSQLPLLANDEVHSTLRRLWRDKSKGVVGRYVILPDHVHLIVAPGEDDTIPISRWIAWWKRASAISLSRGDALWQQGFWDTRIRSEEHLHGRLRYMEANPVRHGLVERIEDWKFNGEVYALKV